MSFARAEGLNPINPLNPATFVEPVPIRTWISIVICHFIFCGHWAKMRGDSLFCWYWWNCFPSLFKLSLLCWYWWNCWSSLSKLFIISDHAFPLFNYIYLLYNVICYLTTGMCTTCWQKYKTYLENTSSLSKKNNFHVSTIVPITNVLIQMK